MNKSTLLAAQAASFGAFFAAANAAVLVPEYVNEAQTGLVCAANASRFDETFQSIPLTNYAVGWRDPSNLDAQLEFLAPDCPVSERFNYREMINAEEYASDVDDERVLGSDFKKVEYRGIETHSRVANKGLMIVVETRDLDSNPGKRTQLVDRLIRRIKRNELIRAHALLLAAAISTGKVWDSDADPDADLRDQLGAGADISGIRPSRVFIGETAWDLRYRAYRAQNTAGGFASAGMTQESLGQSLNAEVMVGESRYQSSASAKTRIGGSTVLQFYAEPGLSPEDPSNVKRFTALCDDGSKIRVFEQKLGPKLTAITVECYQSTLITSTLGIRALTITAS